jgi:membrane fusion protein, macrolide-specific efflux system
LSPFFVWRQSSQSSKNQHYLPVKRGSIIESVYGIGTVTANRTFQFKLGAANSISELFVKEGNEVKKGDSLIRLEADQLIKAPFDGTVTVLSYKVGENIFPEKVVVEVVDLKDRYLVVSLEQRGALRVQKGQKAKLSFDGLREQTIEGEVVSVYSSENNFLIRIDIPNLPPQILPGMTADTAVGIRERTDVLLVPVAAIEEGYVYVKRATGQDKVAIKTGIIDGVMAELTEGNLKEGDQLAVRRKITP